MSYETKTIYTYNCNLLVMLGNLIYEETGKITGTRVLNAEENKIENSVTGEGKCKDIDTIGIGTYWSISVDKNVVYGEGQGIITAKESGETATIRGYGIGRFSDSGKMTMRGTNFYKSSGQLSHLNNTIGPFEFEVDESGNYQLKVWEWK